MDAVNYMLVLIGKVVVGGGAAVAVAYQFFKFFGAKWLDAKFEERLQSLRHQHDQALEELRFRIASLLDRTVKLHQREFDVLPEAWGKLTDAFWNVRAFVSPMQEYPNLDAMGDAQREEFIAKCNLLEWQKDELRRATDGRTQLYISQVFWHSLTQAKSLSGDAYSFLTKNGIFIEKGLHGRLHEMHDLIWNALLEHEINEKPRNVPRDTPYGTKLRLKGDTMMKELEESIHERLWLSTTARDVSSASKGAGDE